MADGGIMEDPWALAPAERELVMTKNRASRLGACALKSAFVLVFARPRLQMLTC